MKDEEKNGLVTSCVITSIVSIIITVILIVICPKSERSLVNVVSVSGAVFSLAGVVLAITQLAKVEKSSRVATKASLAAKSDLRKVLAITEFAEIVSIIRKVKLFVREDKFELAIERVSDIKDFLDRIEFIGGEKADNNLISRFRNKLDLEMDNLERQYNKTAALDKEQFMQDMEGLISILNKMDNEIKNA